MTLPVPWNRWRSRNTARKTNLKNYTITGIKYQNGLHKQIMATPKLTHIRSNKRYIAIFALSFLAFSRPRPNKWRQFPRFPNHLTCDISVFNVHHTDFKHYKTAITRRKIIFLFASIVTFWYLSMIFCVSGFWNVPLASSSSIRPACSWPSASCCIAILDTCLFSDYNSE